MSWHDHGIVAADETDGWHLLGGGWLHPTLFQTALCMFAECARVRNGSTVPSHFPRAYAVNTHLMFLRQVE